MLVHINGERVSLLSDQMESNLEHYYPSSFLTDSTITQELHEPNFAKPTSCEEEDLRENSLHANDFDPKQQDYAEFFHLEKN